jgi:N-acetylmuramidase
MPAVGAAAAYKRIRMGFEGSGIEGYIAKKVLGDTGPKVTAVLTNSPGGLQLLPSERYGAGWLKASVDGREVMSLPQAVKTKNWQAIALNYNGPDYKTLEYDKKLQAAYERHRSHPR